VAEQYVTEFGRLAKKSDTLVIPSSVGDVAGMVITAMSALDKIKDSFELRANWIREVSSKSICPGPRQIPIRPVGTKMLCVWY